VTRRIFRASCRVHDVSLIPLLVLLMSGVVGAAIATFLRQSPILGFLVAGMVIGPFGLDLVHQSDWTTLAAELGVSFLLFDIGLHLSLPKLWSSKKDLFGTAPLQILLTGIAFAAVTYAITREGMLSFLVGAGFALSSTAVALQVMREQGDGNTPIGQSAASILIVQDLFVIALLVTLPPLASGSGSVAGSVLLALGKMAAAFVAIAIAGRWLLQPLFKVLAGVNNSDMFTGASLLVILGVSFAAAEIGLSMSLGAFLAGLALSESRYAHLVRMEISPFRGLLLALFFLTVGMSMDARAMVQYAVVLAVVVPAVVLGKILCTFAAYRAMRYDRVFSVRVSFGLAQASEFTLVLLAWGLAEGFVSSANFQVLSAAVGITMALTPAVNSLGRRLIERREFRVCSERSRTFFEEDATVFVIGFAGFGQSVTDALAKSGVRVTGFDNDRARVAEARASGYDVEYGDPSRPRALSMASRGKARAVIVLSENEEIAHTVVTSIAEMKMIPVFAATRSYVFFDMLNQIIPDRVYMKNEASLPDLLTAVTQAIGAELIIPGRSGGDSKGGPPLEDLVGGALQLGTT